MARCSIWPPARKAMATPSRSGSGAANGPSTRKRTDRTTRKETPMTDTSRLSWQLLLVGPGIDRTTPDLQDKRLRRAAVRDREWQAVLVPGVACSLTQKKKKKTKT